MRENPVVLARFAIGAGGLALGWVSLLIALRNRGSSFGQSSLIDVVAWLGAGWVLIGGAVVFGSRRKSSRLSLLFIAAGCGWLMAGWELPESESALVFTIGLIATGFCPPLTGWAMLSYPTGTVAGRVERVAIAIALIVGVAVLGLAPTSFFDPQAAGCTSCPDNLLLFTDAPGVAVQLGRVGLLLGALSLMGIVALTWWRFAASSQPRRRVVAPVYVTASIYLLAVTWSYVGGFDRGFIGSDPQQHRLHLTQAIALVAVGLAVGWASGRARRIRARLAQIVIKLGEQTAEGGLRDALAQTLGDPDLELAYPLGDGIFVNSSGQSVVMPPTDGRSATPLVRDGAPVGVLIHRQGLLADSDLVAEVASAARLALENERLHAGLRAQEDSLRASRARIVANADAERHRLERDLHDGAQQRLIALMLGLRLVPRGSALSDVSDAGKGVDVAVTSLQQAVDELRAVARGVHPAVLSDEGLAAAIEALAEDSPQHLSIDSVPDERYSAAVENAAYRLVAETVKTGATRVNATRRNGKLVIDLEAVALPERMIDLQDRVGALDGSIGVWGRRDGAVGLHAEIPCD